MQEVFLASVNRITANLLANYIFKRRRKEIPCFFSLCFASLKIDVKKSSKTNWKQSQHRNTILLNDLYCVHHSNRSHSCISSLWFWNIYWERIYQLESAPLFTTHNIVFKQRFVNASHFVNSTNEWFIFGFYFLLKSHLDRFNDHAIDYIRK